MISEHRVYLDALGYDQQVQQILACLRGQPPSMDGMGPCTARTFVQLIADLVALVTTRDAADTLVLADLLPNPANWNGRALRWRAHHRFATAVDHPLTCRTRRPMSVDHSTGCRRKH